MIKFNRTGVPSFKTRDLHLAQDVFLAVKPKGDRSYNQLNVSFSITNRHLLFCQSQKFRKVKLFPKRAQVFQLILLNASEGRSSRFLPVPVWM